MGRLTPSFKITYSEDLQHTEEAINTEIKERDKKIRSLVEMIDDLEARMKDQNVVLDSNNN
jgi:flagellar capping protein FliD